MFIAAPAMATTLQWNPSVGAESYEVRYRAIGAPVWEGVGIATTSYDLDTLPLVAGTRYEFQVFAVAAGSTSGGSDIIRWTLEQPPTIIEIFESPKGVTFVNP